MSSSSLQQVLLPCTGCNGFLRHENSISTPTLGRARSTRRCLLLRFSVHSQLHYIHQRHLQYTALLLPRAHTVETDAVPRIEIMAVANESPSDDISSWYLVEHSVSILNAPTFCIHWNAILGGCAIHGHDAEHMIKAMRCKPRVAACTALLSACRIHGNVEMGEHVAKQILALEPENAAVHVLLSNIYATAGNRHFCENVEQQRKKRGVKKQLSCTWNEVNNEMHTFVVDNQEHPQMIEIHSEKVKFVLPNEERCFICVTSSVIATLAQSSFKKKLRKQSFSSLGVHYCMYHW